VGAKRSTVPFAFPLGLSQQALFVSGRRLFNPPNLYDFDQGMNALPQPVQSTPCTALAAQPKGSRFVLAAGNVLHVWDLRKHSELHQWPAHAARVSALACRPDGNQFASAAIDGSISLWDWQGQAQGSLSTADLGPIHALAWDESGKHLAASGERGSALWTPKQEGAPRIFGRHSLPASGVAIAGGIVAVSGAEGSVELYDVAGGAELRTLSAHGSVISALGFSPDGKRLASTALDGTVRIWETKSWTEAHVMHEPLLVFHSVAFDPSGRYLATSHMLWDVERGTAAAYIPGDMCCSTELDGPALLFGAAEGVWCYPVAEIDHERMLAGRGLAENAPISAIHMPPDRPSIVPALELNHQTWAMAVSPDRRWLATGTHDHVVHLWDARSMKLVRSMIDDGADNAIWSLAFSSDSRWLASGSARASAGRIKVWDVATGDTVMQAMRTYKLSGNALEKSLADSALQMGETTLEAAELAAERAGQKAIADGLEKAAVEAAKQAARRAVTQQTVRQVATTGAQSTADAVLEGGLGAASETAGGTGLGEALLTAMRTVGSWFRWPFGGTALSGTAATIAGGLTLATVAALTTYGLAKLAGTLSADAAVRPGSQMSGTHWDTIPTPSKTYNADPYAVYVLDDASGGSIYIGQRSAIEKMHTYEFPGGGLQEGDGSKQLVTYEKKSPDFNTYDEAKTFYLKARETPAKIIPLMNGGKKARIFGRDYWVDMVE
jgi:WD40 repeat protein